MRWRCAQRYGETTLTRAIHRVYIHTCVRARMCRTSGRELPSPFPDDASLDPDKVCDSPHRRRRNSRRRRREKQKGRPPPLLPPSVGIADAKGGERQPKIPSDPLASTFVEFPARIGLVNHFRCFRRGDRTTVLSLSLSSLTRVI